MENEKVDIPNYETPLPARYNRLGWWHPLVYIGDLDELHKEVVRRLNGEYKSRVYGPLKYILATGYPTVEFIVKADFQLPYPDNGINHESGHFHLKQIDVVNIENNTAGNLQVYDGSFEIKGEITSESIEYALDFINIVLYRIAYGIDGRYEWFLKYPTTSQGAGLRQVTVEDMNLAQEYATKFRGKDCDVLDKVISWYQEGNRLISTNKLLSYLSFYLALENLALEIYSGKMEASEMYGFKILSSEEKKKSQRDGITSLEMKALLETDPVLFAKKAYEEFIFGNNRKTKLVLIAVMGEESKGYKAFIEKTKHGGESYTLYDIRNKIAHGSFTPLEEKLNELVDEMLPILKKITRKFISTILWKEDPKDVKREFRVSIVMADPRSFGTTNDMRLLENDWKIKLEWLY